MARRALAATVALAVVAAAAAHGAPEEAFEAAPPPEIALSADPEPLAPPPPPEAGPRAPEPDYFERHRAEFYRDTPAAGGAPPDAPAAPAPAGVGDGWAAALQAFFSLALLCGVIILGGYLLRRYGKNTPLLAGTRLGEVIGRVHLTPRHSLHYVRTGGRVLVVGVTPAGIHPVAEFDAEVFAEEAADAGAGAPAADFLTHLRTARSAPKAPPVDDDLGALREEVQQLQAYLRGRGGPDA